MTPLSFARTMRSGRCHDPWTALRLLCHLGMCGGIRLIEDARPTRADDGCAAPTAKQLSDMERYLGPSHQSTLTTRHMIRRLSSPTFSPGLWTPAMAITQAIHCNAVDHTRAAHSHDGGSCCRAADAPGGPGLSVAHDSCPSRPVGPLGGPGDGPGAGAPHIVVGGRQAEATTF